MSNTETKIERVEGIHATYSLLDQKFRLYSSFPLDAGVRELIKDAGFEWEPNKVTFVGPSCTKACEAFCVAIAGDIEPDCLKAAYDSLIQGFEWDDDEGDYVGFGSKYDFCRSLSGDIAVFMELQRR